MGEVGHVCFFCTSLCTFYSWAADEARVVGRCGQSVKVASNHETRRDGTTGGAGLPVFSIL